MRNRDLLRVLLIAFGAFATALPVWSNAENVARYRNLSETERLIGQINNYLPWYTSPPSPLPSAYVAIGGALGAGNVYNTGSNVFGSVPGTGMLSTARCTFFCFGAPGTSSHHFLAYGNDTATNGFTHNGAADDCTPAPPPPGTSVCPGGIANQAFGVTVDPAPSAGGFAVALDGSGNLGVIDDLYIGAAVVAGSGTGTPEPSPSVGSLVSYTGTGRGELLLGGAGTGNSARCDYGETTSGTLTCNAPFVAGGGLQPNGSGGYAPEEFLFGAAAAHPEILSGSCTVTGSGLCQFPNGFNFGSTAYTCTLSAQGTIAATGAYTKSSATSFEIYSNSANPITFSYFCTGQLL